MKEMGTRIVVAVVLSALAVLLAGASLVVTLVDSSGEQQQISARDRSRAARVARDVVSLKVANEDMQAALRKANQQLRRLRDCMPEMNAQINSLSVDVQSTGTSYVTSGQQISSYCTPVLYGSGPGGD